jgi:hypothetical protein
MINTSFTRTFTLKALTLATEITDSPCVFTDKTSHIRDTLSAVRRTRETLTSTINIVTIMTDKTFLRILRVTLNALPNIRTS